MTTDNKQSVLSDETKKAIDSSINKKTIGLISTYSIILGVLAFLSLTGAFIGFFHSLNNSQVIAPVDEVHKNSYTRMSVSFNADHLC